MTKRMKSPLGIRAAALASGATLLLALSACSPGDSTADAGLDAVPSVGGYEPAVPEPGTDIPEASVEFGMRPYGDNSFYYVGIENGWYEDVGITITPEPTGLKTAEEQWVPLLTNGQVDVNSATCSSLLPTYENTDELKCIGLAVTFYGSVMFANPDLELKTLEDYIDEGMSFDDALEAALTPLVGQEVAVPLVVEERAFDEIPFEMAGLEQPNFIPLEDSQILLMAQSGQADFAHPSGSQVAYELIKAGWTPVYDVQQLAEYGPGGADSPLAPLVWNNGLASTKSFVNSNTTTTLRFISVMYRIIDEFHADPTLYDQYAPYLNSVAGTSLNGEDLRIMMETLNPFTTFEEASRYYEDEEHAEFVETSFGAQIAKFEEDGVIPEGIEATDVIWAGQIWEDLNRFKTEADSLFEQADGMDLDADSQAVLDEAQQYYEWYNFLDAYRLALSVVEG